MNEPTYSRRSFLKTGGLFSGGLLLSFFIPAGAKRYIPDADVSGAGFAPNAYLSVGPDGSVHVLLAHVEMGQGIWTTLPMLIAEELDCDWNKVIVEHAPPGKPYLHTLYGLQITGGSSTTWSEFDRYRNAGATARAMLIGAAAKKFGVSSADCRTENGYVIAADRRAGYGELAGIAATLPVPEKVQLKDKASWRLIGKEKNRLDTGVKTDGSAMFGMDVHFPGMLIAVVAHGPVFGATIRSFDASAAKAVKGVQDVVQVSTGVAVIADNFWAARKGRDLLKIEWNFGPGEAIDSRTQLDEYRRLAGTKGLVAEQAGDAEQGLTAATKTIDAEYVFPYLAHAPMEPLNCTVRISGDRCEIWTGTQLPGADQQAAARVLGFSPEQVTMNTMFLGGAFGRRASPTADFVAEAVEIAKVSGRFIKMVWTREDDMRSGYYRAAFVHRVRVGLNTEGKPVAWQHKVVGQSIMHQFTLFGAPDKSKPDETSVEGIKDSAYLEGVPNRLVELHSPEYAVPVLWWRSVGNTHTAFVMETMIDELAFAAGKDPVEYRNTVLKSKRHLAALNLAAEKAGWGRPLPEGHYHGIAVHESFRSYVAQVAEVSVADGRLRVHRVTCAIDCGLAVNPGGVKAQMEGGIIFGLTAFLYGEISLEKGRVIQGNFHDYKMVRMNEAPRIDVYIVDSNEKMGGAGEPGVPPVAPAVANAIFAATGNRVRKLPLQASDLVKAKR
jgi:isoquinoline 1-oxidoreductase beta subunit